jgi:hypothetical protein
MIDDIGGTRAHRADPAAAEDTLAAARHTNIANMALGLSIGALAGSILGAAVMSGAGLFLGPALGIPLGAGVGYRATRLREKLHAGS